jgi:sugar phosphate isomerase/epimerase
MRPKIITQDKDFFPERLTDKFQHLRQMGFDGFEVDGKWLLNKFNEVEEAVQKTAFPVVSACGGYGGWIGDFDETKRRRGLADISVILERLGKLGSKGIVVPAAWGMFSLRLPPMVPPRSAEADDKIIMESLQVLNEVANKNNVSVFLEPLNRYEDHMINTLSKARYYIDKAALSNVKIIADFYHMNIEEAVIENSLIEQGSYIQHIHLADSHRFQPGSGHIDFAGGFEALKQIDYGGALAFECRVKGIDPEVAYRQSLQYVQLLVSTIWHE